MQDFINKKPPVISKLEAGIREVKHMKGGDLEKCSSFGSRNKLWSDLKKPFSSYLLQLREARRRREEPTESYFMGPLSPSPLSSSELRQTAAALSPPSKADTHPLSAGSTDCHSSCQSTAIYLEARGLLKRGKSRGWEEGREGGR